MRIGIDLGTTFSAAAYIDSSGKAQIIANRDGSRTTPSVVMFDGGAVSVGEEAKRNSILDPYNVCQFVKRQIGNADYYFEDEKGEKYSSEDISAMILKRIKSDCEDFLGEDINEAVITVPAYFNDAQRKATQDAGKIAGLNVLAVINEPTAAALAFSNSDGKSDGNVMVFDLGGGTFDVTVMKMSEDLNSIDILATGGHKNLGGFDFDNVIIQYVVEEFEKQNGIDLYEDDNVMQDLREKSEAAKKSLSNRSKANIAVMSQGKSLKVEITREKYNEMIQSLLLNAQSIMEMVIEDANLKWSNLDKILLVGGSTRIPAIQNMIEKVSGIKPSYNINPDEAVAMGAAYYADQISDTVSNTEKVKINDVNSHSLGVLSVSDDDTMVNSIILPRNTKLPAKEYNDFYTVQDGQMEIELIVVEGEDSDPEYDTIVGKTILKLKSRPAGSPVRIVMEYDINGMIHVRAIDMIDESDLGEMTIEREANLNDDEISNKISRMKDIDIE